MKQIGGVNSRFLKQVTIPSKSICTPLALSGRMPKGFIMFREGGLKEPICTHPKRSMLITDAKKPERERISMPVAVQDSLPKSRIPPVSEISENTRAQTPDAASGMMRGVKDLGLAIASAIMAIRDTLKSKGLKFKSEGKFDPRWLLKWMWWYSFMRAMSMKIWNAAGNSLAKMSAMSLAADNAKAPFQT